MIEIKDIYNSKNLPRKKKKKAKKIIESNKWFIMQWIDALNKSGDYIRVNKKLTINI